MECPQETQCSEHHLLHKWWGTFSSFVFNVILLVMCPKFATLMAGPLSLSFFFFLNLFWLYWVLAAAHRIFIASWGIFQCGTHTLVVVHRLKSTWASVVVVKRLSFSMACGTFIPQQEIEPTSPTLPGGFLTTGPPGKSPACLLLGPNLFCSLSALFGIFPGPFFSLSSGTTSLNSRISDSRALE